VGLTFCRWTQNNNLIGELSHIEEELKRGKTEWTEKEALLNEQVGPTGSSGVWLYCCRCIPATCRNHTSMGQRHWRNSCLRKHLYAGLNVATTCYPLCLAECPRPYPRLGRVVWDPSHHHHHHHHHHPLLSSLTSDAPAIPHSILLLTTSSATYSHAVPHLFNI
jgi:hypothetical protein